MMTKGEELEIGTKIILRNIKSTVLNKEQFSTFPEMRTKQNKRKFKCMI